MRLERKPIRRCELALRRRECSTKCALGRMGGRAGQTYEYGDGLLLQLYNLWVSIRDGFGGGNDSDYARRHGTLAKGKNTGTAFRACDRKSFVLCLGENLCLLRRDNLPVVTFKRSFARSLKQANILTLIVSRYQQPANRVKRANIRLLWFLLFESVRSLFDFLVSQSPYIGSYHPLTMNLCEIVMPCYCLPFLP